MPVLIRPQLSPITSIVSAKLQDLRPLPSSMKSSITVKLGLYVHGLVRTLGYSVLSVDHGHRQSENMYFFRIRRTERGTKSDITYQFSLQEHCFALSFVLFSDHKHVIQPFSFDFNFPACSQVHNVMKGDITARTASNERHSGRKSIFRVRSFA